MPVSIDSLQYSAHTILQPFQALIAVFTFASFIGSSLNATSVQLLHLFIFLSLLGSTRLQRRSCQRAEVCHTKATASTDIDQNLMVYSVAHVPRFRLVA